MYEIDWYESQCFFYTSIICSKRTSKNVVFMVAITRHACVCILGCMARKNSSIVLFYFLVVQEKTEAFGGDHFISSSPVSKFHFVDLAGYMYIIMYNCVCVCVCCLLWLFISVSDLFFFFLQSQFISIVVS